VAYAIDLAIIAILWTVAATFMAGASVLSFGSLSPAFALLILVPGAYHVLTIGLQGSTWGQRLCGLVVAGPMLEPPTLLQALVSTAVFYLTVPPSGGLALVAVFFLPHRRTIHDLLAGTIVLRRIDGGMR
jgi:uncharacterized RDD family membrane protein YckC